MRAAMNGEKIITKDGKPVRIICYDKKGRDESVLVALVDEGGIENIYLSKTSGHYREEDGDSDFIIVD